MSLEENKHDKITESQRREEPKSSTHIVKIGKEEYSLYNDTDKIWQGELKRRMRDGLNFMELLNEDVTFKDYYAVLPDKVREYISSNYEQFDIVTNEHSDSYVHFVRLTDRMIMSVEFVLQEDNLEDENPEMSFKIDLA
jgi:hypothetical protein